MNQRVRKEMRELTNMRTARRRNSGLTEKQAVSSTVTAVVVEESGDEKRSEDTREATSQVAKVEESVVKEKSKKRWVTLAVASLLTTALAISVASVLSLEVTAAVTTTKQ